MFATERRHSRRWKKLLKSDFGKISFNNSLSSSQDMDLRQKALEKDAQRKAIAAAARERLAARNKLISNEDTPINAESIKLKILQKIKKRKHKTFLQKI